VPAESGFLMGLRHGDDTHVRRRRGRYLSPFIVPRERSFAIQDLLARHAAGGDQQLKLKKVHGAFIPPQAVISDLYPILNSPASRSAKPEFRASTGGHVAWEKWVSKRAREAGQPEGV
jgi:hypothetical protein